MAAAKSTSAGSSSKLVANITKDPKKQKALEAAMEQNVSSVKVRLCDLVRMNL